MSEFLQRTATAPAVTPEAQASVQPAACPFGHPGAKTIDKVSIADLTQAWAKRFGMSVQHPFREVDQDSLDFCQCAVCDLRFFAPGIAGDAPFYAALSKWYGQWSGHIAGAEFKPDYLVALRHIPLGASLLEIGCGCARFDRHLPQGCSYVGLELNPEYVNLPRLRGSTSGRSRSSSTPLRTAARMMSSACSR